MNTGLYKGASYTSLADVQEHTRGLVRPLDRHDELVPLYREQSVKQRYSFHHDVRKSSVWYEKYRKNDDEEEVKVDYFAYERSIKRRLALYFETNKKSSFRIRLFYTVVKILSVALYFIRAISDTEPEKARCFGCNSTDHNYTDLEEMNRNQFLLDPKIFGAALLYVERPLWNWSIQVAIAIFSLIVSMLNCVIAYKGNFLQTICTSHNLIEALISVPFVITLSHASLRHLFVPAFLNCWIARDAFTQMLSDSHRVRKRSYSALQQQIVIVLSMLLCLVVTGTCGIQHIQRGGRAKLGVFQSFYLIIVTFSTVGYGDLSPDIWISQLFIICMICVAFVLLPTQLEQLAYLWVERVKSGGSYSKQRARLEHHVVVTTTHLSFDIILDFLNEFYAHPSLRDFYVVILSPEDLLSDLRGLLQVPIWRKSVIYIRGTALRDADLKRARVDVAEACFILANRCFTGGQNGLVNKEASDQHTILRSWAIKDFAPNCPQYVQIFRPENKMHVKHAEYVICEDEFKYALLALNCVCPGISTFLTLLLHTSRGEEGQDSQEEWHRTYGRHSGNEIYSIHVENSRIFSEYVGKSFTYASFHAHRKYGVALMGVQKEEQNSTIQLNPGPKHIIQPSDTVFYMSVMREELSSFTFSGDNPHELKSSQRMAKSVASLGAISVNLRGNKLRSLRQLSKETTPIDTIDDLKQPNSEALSPNSMAQLTIATEGEELRPRKPSIAAVPEFSFKHNEAVVPTARSLDVDSASGSESTAASSGSSRRPSLERQERVLPEVDCTPQTTDRSTTSEDPTCVRAGCGEHCLYDYALDFPPVTPYVGTSATLCHILRAKRFECCLNLEHTCAHSAHTDIFAYDFDRGPVIIASDAVSAGMYNFLVPLRAHYRDRHEMNPVVLLVDKTPTNSFLESIAWFPMVYWIHGSIENLDHLLRAGITTAEHVIVVNKEECTGYYDDYMSDCATIVAVQTMFRLFPSIRIMTELSHCCNMRFMQFNARDVYALQQSRIEKNEAEKGSHISYMFRLPFAAGSVFSASMLDTLLYQSFEKDYLAQLVRLLLGIDQAVDSGFLSSITISESDMWIRTYGRLYQKLCSTTADIPLGIMRHQAMTTQSEVKKKRGKDRKDINKGINKDEFQTSISIDRPGPDSEGNLRRSVHHWNRRFSTKYMVGERQEITNMVKARMEALGLPSETYCMRTHHGLADECHPDKNNSAHGLHRSHSRRKAEHRQQLDRNGLQFVIINPSFDLKLQKNDIVYILRPCRRNVKPDSRRWRYRHSMVPGDSATEPKQSSASPNVIHVAETCPQFVNADQQPLAKRKLSGELPPLRVTFTGPESEHEVPLSLDSAPIRENVA